MKSPHDICPICRKEVHFAIELPLEGNVYVEKIYNQDRVLIDRKVYHGNCLETPT